jgi:hypothetical protein
MPLAGQLKRANVRLGRGNADLLAIEVITLFDLPGQIQVVLVLLKIETNAWSAGIKFERPGASNNPAKLMCCTAAGSA